MNIFPFWYFCTDIPRVTCDKYKHFGIVGESISIKCAVRSNPPSKLVWQWQQEDKYMEINEEEDSVEAEEEVRKKLVVLTPIILTRSSLCFEIGWQFSLL